MVQIKSYPLTLFVLAAAFTGCSSTSEKTATAPAPATIVLVHGALFTGEGWRDTEAELANLGEKSVSLNVPGRANDGVDPKTLDLPAAATKVCEVARAQPGKVILVGHSQGGALINQAVGECGDKVQALVYAAAVLPLNGETAFQDLDPKVDTGWGKVTTHDDKAHLFRVKKSGPVQKVFFHDISKAQAKDVIAKMVSEPVGIGTTKMTTPNEKIMALPRYYIEATDDQVISIASQRKYQAKAPGIKVFSMKTSHSPFLSQPKQFATYLKQVEDETQFSPPLN